MMYHSLFFVFRQRTSKRQRSGFDEIVHLVIRWNTRSIRRILGAGLLLQDSRNRTVKDSVWIELPT